MVALSMDTGMWYLGSVHILILLLMEGVLSGTALKQINSMWKREFLHRLEGEGGLYPESRVGGWEMQIWLYGHTVDTHTLDTVQRVGININNRDGGYKIKWRMNHCPQQCTRTFYLYLVFSKFNYLGSCGSEVVIGNRVIKNVQIFWW